MPRICEFNGIQIYMYHDDHPWPHVHVLYAEFSAVLRIDGFELERGKLPPRIRRLVLQWAREFESELRENFALAEALQPLKRVPPRR